MNKQLVTPSLLLAGSLVLTACGGGSSTTPSGGDTTTPSTDSTETTTINGVAEAPGGTIALLEPKPFYLAAVDFVFPPAGAAISGLQPVTGATVELIRIDDDGNQVGEVLASTVTSITGDYSLALPSGVSLAGNLIVRITGTGGASMSAMVVEQEVNINPVSQYVLQKFVDDDNLVLADLPVNEVVALKGHVEEFDLTANGDLKEILDQLEDQAGELVQAEIETIENGSDDGTAAAALAGSWNTSEFTLGMHDSEQNGVGTFAVDLYSSAIDFAVGSEPGTIVATPGSANTDVWTNFTAHFSEILSYQIQHESSLDDGSDNESITLEIDANGNVAFTSPFEEELQTVNTEEDLDGPDFGWRWPPSTVLVKPLNANTAVFRTLDNGVRYRTVDTNGDDVKDAIDPNQKDGDEVEVGMGLVLREGSGMTVNSLDGAYGLVSININLDINPAQQFSSSLIPATFSSGTLSVPASAISRRILNRTPSSLSMVGIETVEETDSAINLAYSVTSEGGLVVPDPELQGFVNADASMLVMSSVKTQGSESIDNVEYETIVGLKLNSTQPDIDDAVFDLYPVLFSADTTGYSSIFSLTQSSLSIDSTTSNATGTFNTRGFERSNDTAEVESTSELENKQFPFTITNYSNSRVDMIHYSLDQSETLRLSGYVSADGNTLVLRVYDNDEDSPVSSAAVGLMIAKRR